MRPCTRRRAAQERAFWPAADGVRGAAWGLLVILARMDERLAGYLQVVGLVGHRGHGARLVAGQFHDGVLAGETAYRFPRDEQSRRRLAP